MYTYVYIPVSILIHISKVTSVAEGPEDDDDDDDDEALFSQPFTHPVAVDPGAGVGGSMTYGMN